MRITPISEPKRYNVLRFGVRGDGSTDDTAAIHALRDLAGSGATLVFPPNTYVTTGLTNNVANQTWELHPGATISLKNASNQHAVQLTGAGSALVGGTVNANKANQSSDKAGVVLGANGARVERATVLNGGTYGIYGYNANRLSIRECSVIDSDDTGIFVEASSAASADVLDLNVSFNRVDRSAISASSVVGPGIQVRGYTSGSHGNEGARIVGNVVRMPTDPTSDTAIGIECSNLADRPVVQGNVVWGGSIGISMSGVTAPSVTGNTVYNADLYGLEAAGCAYGTFTGNTVVGNALTRNGISASQSAGKYNAFVGNTISGLTGDAILIQSNEHCTVSANTIEQTVSSYAINVVSSDHCTITGNQLTGASTATKGIVLDTSTGGAISGNVIKDFTQNAVLLYAASAVTLDGITISGNEFKNTNNQVSSQLSSGGALGTNIRVVGNAGSSRNGKSANWRNFKDDILEAWGTGDPEGVLTAGIGSSYHRTDGGAGTCWYVKESGAGNTGWVGK